jgi:hypothetical protein
MNQPYRLYYFLSVFILHDIKIFIYVVPYCWRIYIRRIILNGGYLHFFLPFPLGRDIGSNRIKEKRHVNSSRHLSN